MKYNSKKGKILIPIWLGSFAILMNSNTVLAKPDIHNTETIEFQWIEVPNTKFGLDRIGVNHKNNAYISIVKNQKGNAYVEFDVVGPRSGYARLRGDCTRNQTLLLRRGDFQSHNQVSYIKITPQIWTDATQYQQKLLNNACDNYKK